MSRTRQHTIRECLDKIDVNDEDLFESESLEAQFQVLKKKYRSKILASHPDKGGDPAIFREVQTAFEVLRDMYSNGKIISFVLESNKRVDKYDETWQHFGDMPTASWDFYYEAAEEDVPLYRVELAKSGRSKCRQFGKKMGRCIDPIIPKGSIRVGSLDEDTGGYGRWVHLNCWRVPNRVWKGLPDTETCKDPKMFEMALLSMNEILFSGLQELSKEDKDLVVEYVMKKENYARERKVKPRSEAGGNHQVSGSEPSALMEKQKAKKKEIVPTGYHKPREVFVFPIPGENGVPCNVLHEKRVVLTGIFPEVGGGTGLNLGKAKVKQMVENFGGRVTSAVSGLTDMLIVGKDPGYSKVSQARSRGIQILSLKDLKEGIEGNCIETMQSKMNITSFSKGYGGNSLALRAPPEELPFVQGDTSASIGIDDTSTTRSKQTSQPDSNVSAANTCEQDSSKPPAKYRNGKNNRKGKSASIKSESVGNKRICGMSHSVSHDREERYEAPSKLKRKTTEVEHDKRLRPLKTTTIRRSSRRLKERLANVSS